jgi:hypothetical protein
VLTSASVVIDVRVDAEEHVLQHEAVTGDRGIETESPRL